MSLTSIISPIFVPRYKKLSAYAVKVKVYLVVLIGEYSKSRYLVRKSAAILLGILMTYSEEEQKACTYLACDITVNRNTCRGNSL